MGNTYLYFVLGDWDSDAYLPGGERADLLDGDFSDHAEFAAVAASLGGTVVGGEALQNARYGGRVTPGPADRRAEDAVYTDGADPLATEVISGYYLVEAADDEAARRIAAHVPSGGDVIWRRVFPMG